MNIVKQGIDFLDKAEQLVFWDVSLVDAPQLAK
jgi:hypothetical protein